MPRKTLSAIFLIFPLVLLVSGCTPTTSPVQPEISPSPTPSSDASVTIPNAPDKSIVFVAGPLKSATVYLLTEPDGEPQPISLTPGYYQSPVWSPTGDRVAVYSDHEGRGRVYVIQLNDSEVAPVVNAIDATGPLDSPSGWSPDGRYLLLTSYERVDGEVVVLDLQEGTRTNLTANPAEDEYPAWSPDGSRIAFASDRESTAEEGFEREKQIYLLHLEEGRVERLTDLPLGATHPVWSPDGSMLAFTSPRANGVEDLYVMDADGLNVRQMTNSSGWTYPRGWWHDGSAVVVNHVWGADEQYEALRVPLDGSEPVPLFASDVATGGREHSLRVSGAVSDPPPLPDVPSRPSPVAEPVALVNGVLIDGTGAAPVLDAVVVIRDGRIVAAGPRSNVQIPGDARRIDVAGGTILPGFINAHVHGGFNAYNLRRWAEAGVTTVRDLNANLNYPLFDLRDAAWRYPEYARLVTVGGMITVPDGYPMVPWGSRTAPTVTSVTEAHAVARRMLDAGTDVLKISLESGDIFGQTIPTLSDDEVRAIVEEAHARGTLVSAHVSIASDLERALETGVDDIAHMVTDPLSPALAQRAAESGVIWEPTLELWHGVGHNLHLNAGDNLRAFVNAGGRVALGTDYRGAPGINFDLGMPIKEIRWMHEAGMTPMEIVVAGTQTASSLCNLEEEIGTLEVGKRADILVVNGDPLEDLNALLDVRLVLRDGAIIHFDKGPDL